MSNSDSLTQVNGIMVYGQATAKYKDPLQQKAYMYARGIEDAISLAYNTTGTVLCDAEPTQVYNKKENKTMYTETDAQRDYLANRLLDAFYEKKSDAKKKFGLTQDSAPKNFEELLARITEGKYQIDDKHRKSKDYCGGLGYVIWKDPSVKEDQDGYDAFKKELNASYQKAKDEIKILPTDKGLEALREFENITVQ